MEQIKLTKNDITQMFSIKKYTLWRWIREGKFPQPSIYISTHRCYWDLDDIKKFLDSKKK